MRASFITVAMAAVAAQAAPSVIEARDDVAPTDSAAAPAASSVIPAACTPTPGIDIVAAYDKAFEFQKAYLFDKNNNETFKYYSADFKVCVCFFLFLFLFSFLSPHLHLGYKEKEGRLTSLPKQNRATGVSDPTPGTNTGPRRGSKPGWRCRAIRRSPILRMTRCTSRTTWASTGPVMQVTTLSGRMAALSRKSRRAAKQVDQGHTILVKSARGNELSKHPVTILGISHL